MTASALRALFYVGGAVATAAGLHTVVAGARSVPGSPAANAGLESELRFYSAFYAAYGLFVLRTAPRVESDGTGVRSVAGALFLAGVARAAAWRETGKPHPGQIALLTLELGLPPLMVAAQRRVAAQRQPRAVVAEPS